ncbi:Trk system potassium uptake protein TrkA [Chitinispirillum alkaliphilum]|nr:Trk system potassium uptake protein TrkA [Chitinispirillum alkaliphilum]
MRKGKRHVCVIGLGFFGAGLARALSKNSEVLAIDNSLPRVNDISDHVQRALAIDVKDFNAISAVISDDTDEAIVSIGEDLEASILCTLYLKRLGVPYIRAKASSDEHAEILRSIGADHVIFPEVETAQRVALKIINPNLMDLITLSEGYCISDLTSPSHFTGETLADLHIRNKYNVLVIAIKKNKDTIDTFLPPPDYIIKQGDILEVLGKKEDVLSICE